MANRIIKPDSGNTLVLQDEGGSAALTIPTSGIPDFPNGLTLASNATGGNVTGVTLDDYEEGTFEVTVEAGYTGTGINTSDNQATYIKIGNVVHCHIRFTLDGAGSTTASDVQFGGLPFNTLSDLSGVRNNNFQGIFVASSTSSTTADSFYWASTLYNNNSFRAYHLTSTSVDGLTGSELGTSAVVTIDLTYLISSFA